MISVLLSPTGLAPPWPYLTFQRNWILPLTAFFTGFRATRSLDFSRHYSYALACQPLDCLSLEFWRLGSTPSFSCSLLLPSSVA